MEKPYDPRNPNTTVVRCDRQNDEHKVTTAYITGGDLLLLDLWEWEYEVVVWNSEIIVATGVPWLKKENDGGGLLLR